MKVFIQIGHGIVGAAVISGLCIYQTGSFSEARHTISIIGAIAIVIASLYLLRSRWIRCGHRQTRIEKPKLKVRYIFGMPRHRAEGDIIDLGEFPMEIENHTKTPSEQ